ncbi:hypothetical protein Gogos_017328 [Gossypium gossypioides]|uniref:Uncharacterized protein n=1 Tax=Gossypium gossypioides TaxID=34282 RepID=A0A7J9BAE5_GOSGO|nr:hypothetical protein [Gossypium gossypioides]
MAPDFLDGHRHRYLVFEYLNGVLNDLVLLLLTSGGDPGIISRNAHLPEPEGFDGNVDVGAGQTPQLRLPRIK